MFFLMFLLMCAAVWLLWNICKNTGDALDKQTAIQYELVSLEKKLEALTDKLATEPSVAPSNTEVQSAQVDINNANLKEIMQLPRIGKALAQRIIDSRPYANIGSVKQVQGVSEEMFEELKSLISAG